MPSVFRTDLATLGLYSGRPRANIFPDRPRTCVMMDNEDDEDGDNGDDDCDDGHDDNDDDEYNLNCIFVFAVGQSSCSGSKCFL